MSVERVVLTAVPGENVHDTAYRAVELAVDTSLEVEMVHADRHVFLNAKWTPDQVVARWDRIGSEQEGRHAVGGAWVAYHHDWSNAALFADEIDALRYALPLTMAVAFWRFGSDAHELGTR